MCVQVLRVLASDCRDFKCRLETGREPEERETRGGRMERGQ